MLRRLASWALAVDLGNLAGIAGLALTSYGAFLYSAPAGFIVGGVGLLYFAHRM